MNRAGPLNEPAFKGLVREVLEEVTKPQFATARRETQQQFEQFKTDILSAIRSMLQEFKNDIAAMKDEIICELQATREEATIDKSIHRRVVDLEDDVAQLKRFIQRERTLLQANVQPALTYVSRIITPFVC